MIRKTERILRSGNGDPVEVLYDETNDQIKMARCATDGSQNVTIVSPLESNGAIPVNIQDQHTRAFDLFFAQDVGSATTLTTDTVVDSYTIYCTTGHGLLVGDEFVLRDPVTQHGHTAIVVGITGDNQVDMDRPINYILPVASTVVQERTTAMDVSGAVTRQVFSIGSPLTAELDIVRLMFQMTTTGPVTWSGFGDLGALGRGLIFRQTQNLNGDINHWAVQSTSDLAHLMFDLNIFVDTHPQGVNGLAGRLTYGSQGKHGVTLRIGAGEQLQIIVQDDLTGLISFKVMAQGHIVTD